jgi:hypothetical protein
MAKKRIYSRTKRERKGRERYFPKTIPAMKKRVSPTMGLFIMRLFSFLPAQ